MICLGSLAIRMGQVFEGLGGCFGWPLARLTLPTLCWEGLGRGSGTAEHYLYFLPTWTFTHAV